MSEHVYDFDGCSYDDLYQEWCAFFRTSASDRDDGRFVAVMQELSRRSQARWEASCPDNGVADLEDDGDDYDNWDWSGYEVFTDSDDTIDGWGHTDFEALFGHDALHFRLYGTC